MIACCLRDEITVGGQEGYWFSVDYVLAHGQPWLSHRAHCPPTKKMRVKERETKCVSERERGLALGTLSHHQPGTSDHNRFRNRQKAVSTYRVSYRERQKSEEGFALGVWSQHQPETQSVCNSDEFNTVKITLKTEELKDKLVCVCLGVCEHGIP